MAQPRPCSIQINRRQSSRPRAQPRIGPSRITPWRSIRFICTRFTSWCSPRNNFEVNGSAQMPYLDNQMADTVLIPFWDGNPKHPYPSITVRADFRGADIGDFVYHCHIAEHEDKGMMAIIRVEPNAMAAAFERLRLRLASVGWFGAS